jgi:adiponectin receptor
MLENDESFIYIKNDDEVNLKTDRFNTEPNSYLSPFPNCDLSDSRSLTYENEISHKERIGKTIDLENKNNLLIDNLIANNNQVYNRNGNTLDLKNNLTNNNSHNNHYVSCDNLNSEKNLLKNSKIKKKKSYIEEVGPKIISLDEVPMFRKLFIQVHPFILNGYRIHHEIKDCFLSVFKLHNETLNIWTHMLPFIGFLILLTYLFISEYKNFLYIFLLFVLYQIKNIFI